MGIDLEQPSGECHREENIPILNVNTPEGGHTRVGIMTDCPGFARNNKENTGPNVSGTFLSGMQEEYGEDGINLNSKSLEPHDGMEFDSKEEAFSFYKEYAKSVGFATIIKASRRSRISGKFIDAKFVCTRYGNKRESSSAEAIEPIPSIDSSTNISIKRKRGRINRSWSKTDCQACMHVKRRQDGRWIIRTFIKDHNHEIFPTQAYFFRGHRNLDLGNRNIDALHANQRTRKMYVSMSRQSGGYKKLEKQKARVMNQEYNTQHLSLEEGDAQVMLDFFMCMQDENPNFFYAVDLNEEQRLRNVFWIDAKSRLDYNDFGDVVFFDTTYIKHDYKLPIIPIIGVNHHVQFLLLGCALIVDDAKLAYTWLMRAWLRAMSWCPPTVILSDQDKMLKEVIAEVFAGSRHCFCLWHIISQVPEKLSHVIRQHENFMIKFNKCIFKSYRSEQFKKRWWKIADRFNLRNDTWFQSLYEDREQWVPMYMKDIFLAGMSTIQRSEGMNSFFEKYMQRKTTLKEFLDHYKAIIQEKCEQEAKSDFEAWHKQPGLKSPSPFGKQMVTLYTHAIFKKFQVEVLGVVACHPKIESEDGETKTFNVQDFEENQEFVVVWNEPTSDISCLCRLFEFSGILCRHVMIVLQMSGVHSIPSRYILKRWTKDAKGRQTMRRQADVILSRMQRYNDLCHRAFKLSDEGSLSQGSYNIAFNALEEALTRCEIVNNSIQSPIEPPSPAIQDSHSYEEVHQSNSTSKTSMKNNVSNNRQVRQIFSCYYTS